MDVDSDEYSTISENLTSDTSMNDDEDFIQHQSFSSTTSDTGEESFETDDNIIELDTSDMGIDEEWEMSLTSSSLGEISITDSDSTSNSGMDDWDITNTSVDITAYTFTSRTEEEQMNILREQAYRERPRTSEDCSICFELIQRTQESMALPCTHNFHQECILPWLQEHQTCPNCRKRVE